VKTVSKAVALVLLAAWFAPISEAWGMLATGAIHVGITPDTLPAIFWMPTLIAITATPAWLLVAPIPFLFTLAVKGRVKLSLGVWGYVATGAVLGLLFVVPISELMTRVMIGVEDDGSFSAHQRWLFEAPYIVSGSVAAWLALWWVEHGRKRRIVSGSV
jgi:hypothetical protein